jgi:hypothetical protein
MSSLFADDFARAAFARRMKGHARVMCRPVSFQPETSHAPVCDNVTENRIVNRASWERNTRRAQAHSCVLVRVPRWQLLSG